MSPRDATHWDERYLRANTPWDSGLVSEELQRLLPMLPAFPRRVADLGCGSGTNAVWLAQQGCDVVGFDISAVALHQARQGAEQAGVRAEFIQADLTTLRWSGPPFDLLFDRGCYHTVRRDDLAGYLAALASLSREGTQLLVLAGDADPPENCGADNVPGRGPPGVLAAELAAEFKGLFQVEWLRRFRFQDRGGSSGPPGLAALLSRGRPASSTRDERRS